MAQCLPGSLDALIGLLKPPEGERGLWFHGQRKTQIWKLQGMLNKTKKTRCHYQKNLCAVMFWKHKSAWDTWNTEVLLKLKFVRPRLPHQSSPVLKGHCPKGLQMGCKWLWQSTEHQWPHQCRLCAGLVKPSLVRILPLQGLQATDLSKYSLAFNNNLSHACEAWFT